MKNRDWYLSPWFICALFALWPLIFPLIIGVVLLIKYYTVESERTKSYKMIDDVQAYVARANIKETEIQNKIKEKEDAFYKSSGKLEALKAKLKAEIKEASEELSFYQNELIVSACNLDVDENISSEEYKNELSLLKLKQSELIKSDKAIISSPTQDKKKLSNNTKQLLRCFNAESEIIISNATIKNIDVCRGKISKTYEALNKIFSLDGISLCAEALALKLEELNLIYSYKLRQEQERSEQRAIREQMLEEEKVRREIEVQKSKIEKEEAQFNNEVTKLMAYMSKSANDIEKQIYADKIRELEEKLKILEADKINVLQREQNTRAGFVYVISNIGSFGDNVYKIGMTRRLEPMDRIKELGDASVPFEFDVHALIFSEDAPSLESTLHNTFKDNSVNKINKRKEFFAIDLSRIEEVVKSNHNATVSFTPYAKAEQYRASQLLQDKSSSSGITAT